MRFAKLLITNFSNCAKQSPIPNFQFPNIGSLGISNSLGQLEISSITPEVPNAA